ncbi:hypothetical protein Gohar_028196, partial [Gossypium harknessii]|nr:hypothetical protein [Gossypium harknessii]
GAVKVDLEDVAAGGVIRDDQGRWILGFNKRLGQYFVFNAGLWGIIDALLLLKSRHCDKLLIRMNSTEVLLAISILIDIFFSSYQTYSQSVSGSRTLGA